MVPTAMKYKERVGAHVSKQPAPRQQLSSANLRLSLLQSAGSMVQFSCAGDYSVYGYRRGQSVAV